MSLMIIAPEAQADAANHFARALGNDGDQFTFTTRCSRKDSLFSPTKYFRVCNYGAGANHWPKWVTDPRAPDELPEGVDRAKCEAALRAMGTEIRIIPHAGDARAKLKELGYTIIEEKE